jgi:hypothetical protein
MPDAYSNHFQTCPRQSAVLRSDHPINDEHDH